MSFVKHGFYQSFLMISILLGTGSVFGMEKEEPKKGVENLSQLIEQRYLLDHITWLVENEKVEFDDTSLNCALFYKRADVIPLIIKHQSQLRSSAENPFLRQHVDTNSILLREKRGKNIFSAIDKVKSENRESKGIMSGIKNLVSKTTNEIFFTLGLVTPNALCGLIDKEKKDCDLRLVEFLLKKGAKPNDPQFQFFTPMYYAIKHKNKPVVELLCNYGAKPPSIVDLCHAIDRESEDCDVSIVEFLLQKGVKPNDPQFQFSTPMYYALKHKNKPVIELLCKYGAKPPSIVDLCHAIDRESEDCDVSIVEFLLQNGAKPDDSEFQFFTPMYDAIKHKNKPVIELLCKYGAKITTDSVDRAIILEEGCEIETLKLIFDLLSKKEPHHLRTLFISALSTIVVSKEPWQLYQFIAKLIAKGFVQKSKVAQQKLAMLLCRSRKESIIAQVPRRLLIYLLAFLDYPPCIDCTEMFACCTESFYSKNKEGKTCLELIHDRATSYAQDTEERFLLEDTIMLLDKCWKQG